MPVTIPPPIYYDAVSKLEAMDENVILAALFARDEALLAALNVIVTTREDLFTQFNRVEDLTARIAKLNQQVDGILNAFLIDLDGNANPVDNYAFFAQLIADLKANLGFAETLSAQIIRFSDIQAKLAPVNAKLDQLADLDALIKVKTDYVYGKFSVDPSDDVLVV